jgi:subtilisin family serine protease
VRFRAGSKELDRGRARTALGADRIRAFRSGLEHWRLPPGLAAAEAIERLRRRPEVEYAEPNFQVQIALAPDDTQFFDQWGLRNFGQTGGVPGADIGAVLAWDVSTGDPGVRIAVIDTGIDPFHPDLAPNLWTNPGEIPGNGADDDGNGFIDDVRGWDFVNDDNNPDDDHGHGTHVSGIAAARGGDARGVAGVAWHATLIPLKVFDRTGLGVVTNVLEAIDYALDLGVDVLNNSWGGPDASRALLEAVQATAAADVVFVAAAGNSAANNDITPFYPASYDAVNVIAVAATDHNDARAGFTNVGAESVDLGAPGVSILSTFPGATWGYLSGTSMAAPFVSGAAALIRSVSPGIGAEAVRRLMLDTAARQVTYTGLWQSGGRLDLRTLLPSRDTVPPGTIGGLVVQAATSNTVRLVWTATGDDGPAGRASLYQVRYATVPFDASGFAQAEDAAGAPQPAASGSPEQMEVAGLLPDTDYTFAVRALDEWGNPGPIGATVAARTLPPPILEATPSVVDAALRTGEVATRSLTVRNAGPGTLDWTLALPILDGPPVAVLDPGTDYRVLDSDTPGSPPFEWVDLAESGAPIASLYGDDQMSESIFLGFPFTLYGQVFTELRISTNGFLTFGSGGAQHVNRSLPNPQAPPWLIAPLWDDLDFQGAQRVRVAFGPGRFTVQFTDVPGGAGAGRLTFQVSLHDSGDIVFRYLSVGGEIGSSTIGIQDGAGTRGVQLAFNSAYVHDRLTVHFRVVRPWLRGGPAGGRLEAGSEQPVLLTLDATDLEGGAHRGAAVVRSNDPQSPIALLPVNLSVTPVPMIAAGAPGLSFGQAFAGYAAHASLTLLNPGTAPLTVTALRHPDPRIAAQPAGLTIPARGSAPVTVTWTPLEPGSLAGDLVVESDAIDRPALAVPLTGFALPPPVLQYAPGAFAETLKTGAVVSRVLRIDNAGQSDLIASLAAEVSTLETWLRVPAGPVTVPPGGFRDLAVTIDAGDFGTRTLSGSVRIDTNIPLPSPVRLPVTLAVIGAPNLTIGDRIVSLVSSRLVFGLGSTTSHALPLALAPGGGGTLEVTVQGNYERAEETASVLLEGELLGSLGANGFTCGAATAGFGVTRERLETTAVDGVVQVTVQNSPDVNLFCATNLHTVRLHYPAASERVDFGVVYTGSRRTTALEVRNRGAEPLTITSIRSDRSDFTVGASSMDLLPGGWQTMSVSYQPQQAGSVTGTLTFQSNDPDTPTERVTLTGSGLSRPIARLFPSSLVVRVVEGEDRVATLRLSNVGYAVLTFTVTLGTAPEETVPAALFLTAEPLSGSIPPGASVTLELQVAAGSLPPGRYPAELVILTNDPGLPTSKVPVPLEVFAGCTDTNPDGDWRGAGCDNCPLIWNAAQEDADGDAIGDVCAPAALCGSADLDRSGASAGRIDGRDLGVFARAYGTCPGQPGSDPRANLDQAPDPPLGCIGPGDFLLFMSAYATACTGTP